MHPLTKTCKHCQIEKPVSDFSNNKTNKDGKNTWCRECSKIRNAELRSARAAKWEPIRAENEDGSIIGDALAPVAKKKPVAKQKPVAAAKKTIAKRPAAKKTAIATKPRAKRRTKEQIARDNFVQYD